MFNVHSLSRNIKKKSTHIHPKIGRTLVLDELFDLQLYAKFFSMSSDAHTKKLFKELMHVETAHLQFWKDFFKSDIQKLNMWRAVKFHTIVFIVKIFGDRGAYLVLESIEIYGIKKYLNLWKHYKGTDFAHKIEKILHEEVDHEDKLVSQYTTRAIKPEKIRNFFLGFNDGLVEILGAVSGFFAAFDSNPAVLLAGFTVAVAGSISMAAGAYVALNSEKEIEDIESDKQLFLNPKSRINPNKSDSPIRAAVFVGISYFVGSMVPVLPVVFGAHNALISVIAAVVLMFIVSFVLSFLSGMDTKKRIITNLVIIAFAVGITYVIALAVKQIFGVSVFS